MRKKNLLILLQATVLLAACFTLHSCGDDDEPPSPNDEREEMYISVYPNRLEFPAEGGKQNFSVDTNYPNVNCYIYNRFWQEISYLQVEEMENSKSRIWEVTCPEDVYNQEDHYYYIIVEGWEYKNPESAARFQKLDTIMVRQAAGDGTLPAFDVNEIEIVKPFYRDAEGAGHSIGEEMRTHIPSEYVKKTKEGKKVRIVAEYVEDNQLAATTSEPLYVLDPRADNKNRFKMELLIGAKDGKFYLESGTLYYHSEGVMMGTNPVNWVNYTAEYRQEANLTLKPAYSLGTRIEFFDKSWIYFEPEYDDDGNTAGNATGSMSFDYFTMPTGSTHELVQEKGTYNNWEIAKIVIKTK